MLFLLDSAQAVGQMPIDGSNMQCDFLAGTPADVEAVARAVAPPLLRNLTRVSTLRFSELTTPERQGVREHHDLPMASTAGSCRDFYREFASHC